MKLRKVIIPMLAGLLMLLLACPPAQAISGHYYVVPNAAPLRECGAPECATLLTAYQGEAVEILERTNTGWSRVRLVERSGIGWIRSDSLTYSRGVPPRPAPTYYVNISSLTLRDAPNPNSGALTTLHFNDPVEMLGVGASGWAQVRDLRSNMMGYVPPRNLSSAPLKYPKSPRRRAPARKAPPKEETPEPPKVM